MTLSTVLLLLTLSLPVFAGESGFVTVKADGTPLRKVLSDIARQMDYNIFLAPGVSGNVTSDLKRVPGFGALDLILTTQPEKLTYKVVDKTIVVGTPEKLQRIPDTLFR